MMAIIQRDAVENSMSEVCPAGWPGIIFYIKITKILPDRHSLSNSHAKIKKRTKNGGTNHVNLWHCIKRRGNIP